MARPPGPRDPLISILLVERLTQGLSQKEVATAAGLSRDAVNSLETGKRGPSLATFKRYAAAHGYDVTLTKMEES